MSTSQVRIIAYAIVSFDTDYQLGKEYHHVTMKKVVFPILNKQTSQTSWLKLIALKQHKYVRLCHS